MENVLWCAGCSSRRFTWILTSLIMFGSVTKHTSGSVDMSIVITVGTGALKAMMGFFSSPKTLWHAQPWWPSQNMKWSDRFVSKTLTMMQLLSQRSVTLMRWTKSGGHLEHVGVWTKMYNGSNKKGQLQIQLASLWRGLIIDSLSAFSRCDRPPPDLYIWGSLKDNVYENNPQSITEPKVGIPKKRVC